MVMRPQTVPDPGFAGVATPGRITERYHVLSQLGSGGMGQVFAVRDLHLDRTIALKRLGVFAPESLLRLKNEFRVLGELQHRNVIVPYELFFDGDCLCYTMELVEGVSIVDYCRDPAADGSRIQEASLQLLDALDAIHARGIAHRDLKPGNILVTRGGRVVVLDFGLSKAISGDVASGITREQSWVGTPAYMAPEQFRPGSVSAAADLYAFGTVLYECLTGAAAFPQRSIASLLEAKNGAAIPLAPGNRELAELVVSLLDPEPTVRPSAARAREVLDTQSLGEALGPRARRPVGRDDVLQLIDERLRAVVDQGRAQILFVRGEAGSGKSTVLEAVQGQVPAARDAIVSYGRCSKAESVALQSVDSLLDDFISHVQADARVVVDRCYPRHASALRTAFPATDVLFGRGYRDTFTSSPLQRAAARPLALQAVADLLARASEQCPLVLLLDDLHRSDCDGSDAVLQLILQLGECRVLFVVSGPLDGDAGPTDVDTFLSDCVKFLGDHRVTQVRLSRLDDAQLERIVGRELPGAMPDKDAMRRLCEAARGNPGMCTWYVRALASDTRGVVKTSADPGDPLDSLLVGQLWSRLDDHSQRLLASLCLARGSLPDEVLAPLLGTSEAADAALLELEHFGFLRRYAYAGTGQVSVWHPRLAEQVLRLVGDEQRLELHRTLANLFAKTPGARARAAAHYRDGGDEKAAASQYASAATAARDDGLHHQAIVLLRAGIELERGAEARREMEVQLADSLGRIGRLRESARISERLCAEPDLSDATRAELRRRCIGHYAALADVAAVKRLLGIAPARRPISGMVRVAAMRLRIAARPPWKKGRQRTSDRRSQNRLEEFWTAGSRLLHVDPIFAVTTLGEHLQLAFRSGSVAHEAMALALEAVMVTSAGEKQLTRASTLLASAERRAIACGDERVRAVVHQMAGFMWGNVGRYDEAIAEGQRCIEALQGCADALGPELSHAQVELGWRLAMVGRLREASSDAPKFLRRAVESEDPVLSTAFRIHLAQGHLAADHIDDCAAHLADAEASCPRSYEVGRFGIWGGRVCLLMYMRDWDGLAEYVAAHRREIEGLRLLGLPAVRAVYDYRVGVAMQWAFANGGSFAFALRGRAWLMRARRNLARRTFPVAVAHHRLLEAGHHALNGDGELALGLLREAGDRFAALQWRGPAAMCKWAYAKLQEAPLEPDISATLDDCGIASPDRWSAVALPPLIRKKN